MKKMNLVDIIGKISATSPKSAQLAYNVISQELSNGSTILLSFSQIEDCSSAFLNAFIGKLYIEFDSDLLSNSFQIADVSNSIWLKKLEDAKRLGMNESLRKVRKENLEELLS